MSIKAPFYCWLLGLAGWLMLSGCVRLHQTMEVTLDGSGTWQATLAMDSERLSQEWIDFLNEPDVEVLVEAISLEGVEDVVIESQTDEGSWMTLVLSGTFEDITQVRMGWGEERTSFSLLHRANGGLAMSVENELMQQATQWAASLEEKEPALLSGMEIQSTYHLPGPMIQAEPFERDGASATIMLTGGQIMAGDFVQSLLTDEPVRFFADAPDF